MAGTFEAFGNQVRGTMAGFASSVSGEIISSISPIIYTGIMIYFFARAYQITTGRAEGAIPDLITQCVKIVLVAFFGLNAANFVTYVIPAVYGIENLLLNAISHATTGGGISNAWGAADQTWETFMSGFQAIYNIWSNSSWSVWSIGESIATSLFIILLMVLMLAVCIYFMFLAVGYLLLYEIFLVMGLAFGPLFICTLMFTVTRTWFDGWLRAVVCWAFTLVAVAGTLMLINGIFLERVQQVSDFASAAEGGKDYGVLLVNLGVFAVVVLAIATVVKSIPSFAAGLTAVLREQGIMPDYAAGLSLGEYSALACAGVFDMQTAVALTAFRGKAMAAAAAGRTCGMTAVLGLDETSLQACCSAAAEEGVVQICNYNCPGQLVIGGEKAAVDKAADLALAAGARRCLPLNVSGAFHTLLMHPAGDALREKFQSIHFAPMQFPVLFNCLGHEMAENDTVATLLEKQVQSGVRWEATVRRLAELGVDTAIEIGPGRVLTGFVKKTVGNAISCYPVETAAQLQQLLCTMKGA